MKRLFTFRLPFFLLCTLLFVAALASAHADPLRVFIRGGVKTHGPNAHEHERFLNDWKALLNERGMQADGGMDFPTAEQLEKADVMVMYAQDAGNITPEQKPILEKFIKRGGGLVVIHDATVATKPETSAYWKSIIGGSWVQGKTQWKEGPMNLYYVENERIGGGHPITKGASNFKLDDEIYYDMDISPDVRVLATAYTPKVKEGKKAAEGGKINIFDIQPQMWVYERTAEGGTKPYRAFVTIPGHLYSTFALPQYRAVLLRGIAWAAHRENLDEFCKKEELDALTYPPGGPSRPAAERAQLEVHPDFNMTLVASEPLITKPICVNWDAAGRMWVAESPEYPNGRRGMRPDYRGKEWMDHGGIDPDPGKQDRPALDRISILTSSKHDGVMDTKQLFYEGLDLVTGFVFYKDGVIVTQAPDILFIHDPGPDGKARKVEKLYTGLGIRDTHAVINNPRWGWDGWIYATHGYSSSQHVTTGDGKKDFGTIGSGVVRFKPDGSAIEQYSSKGGNTWGLEITADNRVMWTQPTSGQLFMHTVLPESTLSRGKIGNTNSYNVVIVSDKVHPAIAWDQLPYMQIDMVGSFTAAAGCVVYDGGSWPSIWNDSYFCTEPTVNIIHQRFLDPSGSSFTWHKEPGREETEFVRGKDMWFRPIEVRVGPDGAVYVLDFYNQAVIHNDTRGADQNEVNAAVRPDRDHYFGRIWRIDNKDAKKLVVPDLSKAGPADLVKAIEHPNREVRMTASILLGDKLRESASYKTMSDLAKITKEGTPEAKIAALWTMVRGMILQEDTISTMLADSDASVRRNAALVVEYRANLWSQGPRGGRWVWPEGLVALLGDANDQVRIAALRAFAAGPAKDPASAVNAATGEALGGGRADDGVTKAIVGAWPKCTDDFQRSAVVAAASRDPVAAISLALDATDGTDWKPLVNALAQNISEGDAAGLVATLADKPASADALKRTILEELGKSLKTAPKMTPALSNALARLFESGAKEAALPIATKWDKNGELKPRLMKLTAELLATLADSKASDDARLAAVHGLVGAHKTGGDIFPLVVLQFTKGGSANLQREIVAALAGSDDPAVGTALAAAYAKLPPEVQTAAFDVILKRADWTNAFLDAIKAKEIEPMALGPANMFRLRAHPDKAVARRATELLDELNPLAKAKKEAVAKLLPTVEQKGDPEHGKQLFTTTCTICHSFHGTGAEIGPNLTGMGAHGVNELLVDIVDPNAEVDPSFTQWNIETKDGQAYAGVIASENSTTITLKSLAGVQQIKKEDVKTRVNTQRSLMPEGFDGLGGEALRDIIAYLQSVDGVRFRMLDLHNAFTTSTSEGLYQSTTARDQTFQFTKTGTVSVDGVPFSVMSPEAVAGGANIVVLGGGPKDSYAKTLPKKVEIKVGGFKANRIHILGGVTGWGYNGTPTGNTGNVLKINVRSSQDRTETIFCKNGAEFADYIRHIDVPGSKYADGVVKNHQMRWFTKELSAPMEIDKITLENLDSGAAPTIVAITAELAEGDAAKPAAPAVQAAPKEAVPATPAAAANDDVNFKPQFDDAVPQPPATRPANGPRVLLVGGGSSHDFVKYFGETDKATLAPHVGWVDFTQNANGVPAILGRVDVLVWSANQPVSSATCKALIDYANSGKGIVALHPGTWYAWRNFPEWNAQIVGGGTRSHDKLGPYTVKITDPNNPITKGVTPSFEITDELYNYTADPSATPIEVLAEATSPLSGKTFPQVFIVKHPKSRIVGITLGHDARAHDLPEFQTLLKNSVEWAAGK